jgi:hypothetical protein
MTGARRVRGVAAWAALAVGALVATPGVLAPATAAMAPAGCRQPSLAKQIKRADDVFRGVVDKVRPVKGKGKQRSRTYKVTPDRVYQGSLVTASVVVTAAVGTPCPPATLKHGKRYIFFVTEDGSRLMATPATAKASTKLTAQVIAKLGDGVQPRKSQPATATFTMVADAAPPALSRLLAPGAALVIVSLLGLLVVGRLGRRPR